MKTLTLVRGHHFIFVHLLYKVVKDLWPLGTKNTSSTSFFLIIRYLLIPQYLPPFIDFLKHMVLFLQEGC